MTVVIPDVTVAVSDHGKYAQMLWRFSSAWELRYLTETASLLVPDPSLPQCKIYRQAYENGADGRYGCLYAETCIDSNSRLSQRIVFEYDGQVIEVLPDLFDHPDYPPVYYCLHDDLEEEEILEAVLRLRFDLLASLAAIGLRA